MPTNSLRLQCLFQTVFIRSTLAQGTLQLCHKMVCKGCIQRSREISMNRTINRSIHLFFLEFNLSATDEEAIDN